LRQDHSRKPAYDELLKLIKGDWWLSPTRMTTDASGKFAFTGFLGEYKLSLDQQKYTFSVQEKGETAISILL
jgi:endo-1,4-beta-xylanase